MAKQYKALMIPIELHREIEKLAKKNGVSMIKLVEQMKWEWNKNHRLQ